MYLDIDRLDAALRRAHALFEAAELHGMLSSYHCAARPPSQAAWRRELLGDFDPRDLSVREAIEQLDALWEFTGRQFAGDGLSFQPLLPADGVPLSARVRALGTWCQGFLFGFGVAAHGTANGLPGEVREFLNDLQQIAAVGPEADAHEAERAYVELVEYVRIGALLVREHFAAREEERADHAP